MFRNGCAALFCIVIASLAYAPNLYPNNCTAVSDISNYIVMSITAYKDTFSDVQQKLGPATKFSIREQRSLNVCYNIPSKDGNSIVVFSSNAFGGWDLIHIFEAYKNEKDYIFADRCFNITQKDKAFSTKSGLSFNTTKYTIVKMLGKPYKYNSTEWRYHCCSKFKFCKGMGFGYSPQQSDTNCTILQADRCHTVNIFFIGDMVNKYELFMTESY